MSEYISGLVSVIMPTYKRSEKLIRAIDSVLNQTYGQIELLVVNDNEPDDEYTDELKKRVALYTSNPKFNLVIQDRHINGAVARNVGIKLAKGEYIAFLDDDDWWKENKIEHQVSALKSLEKSWGGVSCRIEQYDGDKLIAVLPKYNDGYVYKDILMLNCDLATSTLLLRHADLDKTSYFDENLLRHQDLQLLVNFTSKYKLKQIDELLHCCDVSDTSNRPSGDKLLEHKKRFFKSIKPEMDKLSKSERRCVYAMHNFEVGYVYMREGKKARGIKYMMKVFSSVKAVRLTWRKILIKVNSSR